MRHHLRSYLSNALAIREIRRHGASGYVIYSKDALSLIERIGGVPLVLFKGSPVKEVDTCNGEYKNYLRELLDYADEVNEEAALKNITR